MAVPIDERDRENRAMAVWFCFTVTTGLTILTLPSASVRRIVSPNLKES